MFDSVLTEEPRFFGALYGKMKAYRELFQWENVILCCDKILEINPKAVTAIEHKIWSLYALDKIETALELANEAIKEYPDNPTIQKCLDECLKKKGKKEKPILKEKKIEKPTKPISRALTVPIREPVTEKSSDFIRMKNTNKWLIGIVYTYLAVIFVLFLLVDSIFFNNLNSNTVIFIQIGFYACILGSFLILIFLDKNTNLRELGISTQNLTTSIFVGIFVSSGFLITALLFWKSPMSQDFSTILNFGILCIFVGFVEEFYFRGYIQSKARKSIYGVRAIVITGLLFAFLHIPKYIFQSISSNSIQYISNIPSTIESLIIVGLLFGFIRENTKNIIGPIIGHATWDFYLFIYTPMNTIQLQLLPTNYNLFITVASYAMIGTFLLAWAISSALRINILEDPRELDVIIEGISNIANKFRKKILKLQYKTEALSMKQNYYRYSNLYAFRSLEIVKRKLETKIAYFNARRDLYIDILDKINVDNYSEMMNYKDVQEKKAKKALSISYRRVVSSPVYIEARKAKRPEYNSQGFKITGINSRIREFELNKLNSEGKIELYSKKQELYQDKNPRYLQQLEFQKEKLKYQIEYYNELITLYSNIAETVTRENQKEKRNYLNEQVKIARKQLYEKVRTKNLQQYHRTSKR